METYRLFAAVRVPDDVRARIRQSQAELQSALPRCNVAWTRPEQFHLTLKFLGPVDVKRIDELELRLGEACARFAALALQAGRIGFFPEQRLPRVIWAGVEDARQELPALQRTVESAVADFTREQATGRFSGHVTLGRIRAIGRADADRLAELARSMADRSFGSWVASHVELMRSELSSAGARHSVLATFALNRPAITGTCSP